MFRAFLPKVRSGVGVRKTMSTPIATWKQEWSDRHIVRYIRIEWVDYECYECGDVHVIGWRITYGFQHGELHEDASNRYEWDCAELRHSLTRPA